MIKLVFTLRRRPDLLCEEYQRYWREMHAPLVDSNYYDGAVELRWHSLEEMKSAFITEEQTAGNELLEDERDFINLPASRT